ncbi:MAG: helix-turn-helix transcriptional regulator [Eubacterium sp.]|nr:helix-turn-helix transcriptional regulator [Eubacterium sp.]
MAAKKVGTLIREARLEAGYTQEQLARKVKDLTANDISKAERGEKDLTKEQLKKIALATGVTQSSLLNAPKGGSSSSSSKKKTTTSSASKKKTTSSTGTSMKVTATERKLVELYREADSDRKKMAMNVLKGESNTFDGFQGNLIDGALDALKK